MEPRHIGLAVFAAFIWGATFPVTQAALETTPPLLFAALRFICAAAFILVVPRPPISWPMLIVAGLLLGAGQYGLLFVGMASGVPPGLASLLVHTQAFFTIGIAIVVFSERLSQKQLVAVALGIVGLGVLAFDRGGSMSTIGLMFVLLAALSGASGNNVLKSLGRVNMLGVAVWMSLAAPIPLLVLSAVFEGGDGWLVHFARLNWTTVGALAYSALLATIAAFAIWGRLLTGYDASMVMPYFLLVPVFGIGLSVVTFGETFTLLRAVGGGLIFAGMAVATVRRRRFA